MDRSLWHARIKKALRESPREARALADRYLRAARRADDAQAVALARFFQGESGQLCGALRRSAADYGKAIEEFESMGEERLAGLVRLSALPVHALLGDAPSFKRDLRVLRPGAGDPLERAFVEQAAGNGWRALGDESRAEKCFREGLALLAKKRDPRSASARALLRQDLGVALAYRGATGPALHELKRARTTLARLGQSHSVAMCDANLAWARGLAGDLRDAWLGLGEAARALDESGDARRAALARVDAVELRLRLGDALTAAVDAAREARLLTSYGLASEAGRAWLLGARAERHLGRDGRARQAARRAHKLLNEADAGAFVALAEALAGGPAKGVATRLRRAGLWSWAVDALLDEAERATPARGSRMLEREAEHLPVPFRRWILPARLRLRARVEPKRRIPLLRRAVRSAETLRFLAPSSALRATSLARYLGLYEELAQALLERGRPRDLREAFWVLDSARARTMREELDRAAPGSSDTPSIRRVRERIEVLWRVIDERTNGPQGVRAASTPLLREIQQQEKELVRLFGDVSHAASAPQPSSRTENRAYLTWSAVGGRLIGFLSDSGEVVSWDAGSVAATRRDLDGLRFQVERRLYGATDHGAADLLLQRMGSRMLPSGVVDELPPRLHVVLPMEVGSLPCEALPWKGGCVLDACRIEYLPCAGWPIRKWRRAGGHLVIGLDSHTLPDVDREVESVAALLDGASRLAGIDATRDSVLGALAGKRVVHFAGHAEAREDVPPLSALRVRDGWITASDLAAARLDGSLVVLSACRTGDPALGWFGESLGGFPRAVLGAGAAGVLASRWPVRDEVARVWMESFYGALDDGPVSDAAATAARVMRDRSGHVADWGAFLLVRGGRG